MSENYPGTFSGSNDDSSTVFDQEISNYAARYERGDHTMPTETDADDLRSDAENLRGVNDDGADLLEQAAEMYESMDRDPSAFECPDCGLRHSHSMTKNGHQLTERNGLNVRSEFANQILNFNQRCHCGVNELAMLLDFIEHIDVAVFRDIDNDDIPPARVVTTAERLREAIAEGEHDEFTDDSVETRAEILDDVGRELVQAAQEWQGSDGLTRVLSVRNAADSAPIAQKTREEIETIRQALASELDHDPVNEIITEELSNTTDPETAIENAWFRLFDRGVDVSMSEIRERVNNRFFD